MAHENQEVSYSPLQALPLDLCHQVLSFAPDPLTLRSLSQTCVKFRKIFVEFEASITKDVISRHICPELHHEVFLILAASQLTPDNPPLITHFMDDYSITKTADASNLPWSLPAAIGAYLFNHHVDYFAGRATDLLLHNLRSTAGSVQNNGANGGPAPPPSAPPAPSPSEVLRLKRALYRREIMGNLSRCTDRFSPPWERWCFANLAMVEIEQVICVMSAIRRLIDQAMLNIDVDVDRQLGMSESEVLARGLETLHALVEADTVEECRELLLPGGSRPWDFPISRRFRGLMPQRYSRHLREEAIRHWELGFSSSQLSELSSDQRATVLNTSVLNHVGDNPGPAMVFEHLHRDAVIGDLPVGWETFYYRRWGYVLWDGARLDQLGVFTENPPARLMPPPADPPAEEAINN